MEDNGECSIVRVGDVRIKIFNGCSSIISDVRYILTFQKSLMYLEMFDEHDMKFIGEKR